MKRIDPSLITVFLVMMFIGAWLDMPIIIFGFIAYMIFRGRIFQKPRDRSERHRRRYESRDRRYQASSRRTPQRTSPPRPKPKARRKNPFKATGIEKFKDYNYEGAIEDWEKSLEIDNTDASVHFNIACAYSLTENKDKAFEHLSKAVANGFKDFEKIKSHDALAYIRVQDEFDTFVENGYQYRSSVSTPSVEEKVKQSTDLLEQLNQLSKMREKGLLTEEEFEVQKKRLLG